MNKKTLLLALSLAAFIAVAVPSVSAALPEWLLNGAAFGEAIAAKTTGELELAEGKNKIEIKCGLILDGTAGLGGLGTVTLVLTLAGVEVTSAAPLLCANVKGCPEAEFFPKSLPWKTELETLGAVFLNSYYSALYVYSCKIIGVLVTNECTTPTEAEGGTSFAVENKAKGVVIGVIGAPQPRCSLGSVENEIWFVNSTIITSLEGTLSVS